MALGSVPLSPGCPSFLGFCKSEGKFPTSQASGKFKEILCVSFYHRAGAQERLIIVMLINMVSHTGPD